MSANNNLPIINQLTGYMTESDIFKQFNNQTGKSRTSSAFISLMRELKDNYQTYYLGSTVRHYQRDNVAEVFKYKTNPKNELSSLIDRLSNFIEWVIENEKLVTATYPLRFTNILSIQSDWDKWNRFVGQSQAKFNISIELVKGDIGDVFIVSKG